MIQPVKSKPLKHAPIHSFAHTGKQIYAAKNDGHFLWDADPHMCDPDCPCKYEDDGWLEDATVTIITIESQPLLRKTRSCRPLAQKHPFDDDEDAPPPWIGLPKDKNKPMTEDEYLKRCFEILAEEGLLKCPPPPTICSCSLEAYQTPAASTAPLSCCMLQPEDFPPLETIRDSTSRVTASPYVRQTVVHSTGNLQPISPSEEALNWQTSNAVVQNNYLRNIDGKLNQALKKNDHLASSVSSFRQEAQQMHDDLLR
ncbi:hypothetical protein JCGZ_24159 [Jatropha curcas]|uniref:Uncharacterized protein n=1 Tax=Jatropha curcas TaxID=180498 RepID=A0A067JNX1_JATCU|nr:hypothetical protein JCGZ_24159 [Jatropha curcas]